jgi:hypothetical protein
MNKNQFPIDEIQSLLTQLEFNLGEGEMGCQGVYIENANYTFRIKPYPVDQMESSPNAEKKGLFNLLITFLPIGKDKSWVSGIKLDLLGKTSRKFSAKTNRRGQTWFKDVPAGEGYRVEVKKPLAPFHWLLENLKDWQPLKKPAPALGFKGAFREHKIDKAKHKQIRLGSDHTVAIVIEPEEQNDEKFKVLIYLRPLETTYLPENLKLKVILETGETFEAVAKTGNDIIYLKDDNLGKRFHVVVQLNDISVTVL